MNGCLKCIHKPFCTLSVCGAVCSSFKDKDRYADRNKVIREFVDRLCEGRVSNDPVVIAAKCLLQEMTEEAEL